MKILKAPEFEPIKCDICGCEYEFDGNPSEITTQKLYYLGKTDNRLYLDCPICGERNILIFKEKHVNSNTCVICGAEIPEGRQVCPICEGDK